MAEVLQKSAAERFSRLFRKAGVFLGKGQIAEALTVFCAGETLALSLGDDEKLALFREEMARCREQLKEYTP